MSAAPRLLAPLAAGLPPGFELLGEMTIVVVLAVAASAVLTRLQLPAVVGYLVVGAIAGPNALGLVASTDRIALVAEVGVILLLFTVGMKLSLRELVHLGRLASLGGTLQIGLTVVAVAGLARAWGWSISQGIFLGYLVALSSTALVVRLLEERGDAATPHGRLAFGALIVQDLAVVPMFLSLPLLADSGGTSIAGSLGLLARSVGLLAAIVVGARFVIPWVLRFVVSLQSRELFTLTVNLVVLGTALLVGMAGLSMPLGAFLAGVVASESEYGQQILEQVTPLRDVFTSLFFVSLGMLFDPSAVAAMPGTVALLVAALVLLKAGLAAASGRAAGVSWGHAAAGGLALAQIGEFSFVMALAGLDSGLVDASTSRLFVAVAVPSMLLTPFVLMLTPRLVRLAAAAPAAEVAAPADAAGAESGEIARGLDGHVIIIGCGVSGRRVVRALQLMKVDRVIVELNPRTVQMLVDEGERAIYGDATRDEVLRACGVLRARSLVISGSDPASARAIVSRARALNPGLDIIARTRFVREVEELTKLGASRVVVEELEASLELASTVMAAYGAPQPVIERERALLRAQGYRLLRPGAAPAEAAGPEPESPSLAALLEAPLLDEVELPRAWPLAGASLRSLNLRSRTGCVVVAHGRRGLAHGNPDPELALEPGDVLVLSGSAAAVESARKLLLGEAEVAIAPRPAPVEPAEPV